MMKKRTILLSIMLLNVTYKYHEYLSWLHGDCLPSNRSWGARTKGISSWWSLLKPFLTSKCATNSNIQKIWQIHCGYTKPLEKSGTCVFPHVPARKNCGSLGPFNLSKFPLGLDWSSISIRAGAIKWCFLVYKVHCLSMPIVTCIVTSLRYLYHKPQLTYDLWL